MSEEKCRLSWRKTCKRCPEFFEKVDDLKYVSPYLTFLQTNRARKIAKNALIIAIISVLISLFAIIFNISKNASTSSRKYSIKKYEVGPFKTGRNDMFESESFICLRGMKNEIEKIIDDKDVNFILIVGCADKRGLSSSQEGFFGSNLRLAKSRALWVKKEIFNDIKKNITIIVLETGPNNIGPTLSKEELARDRYVYIYIFCTVRRF